MCMNMCLHMDVWLYAYMCAWMYCWEVGLGAIQHHTATNDSAIHRTLSPGLSNLLPLPTTPSCPVMKGLRTCSWVFCALLFLGLEMAALRSLPPALLDYRLVGLIMSGYFKGPLYLSPPLILSRMRGTYGPITYLCSSWRHYPQPNPQGLCIHLSTNGIYFWPWPQQQHQGLCFQDHG